MLMATAGLALLQAPAFAAKPTFNLREGLWRVDFEATLPGKGPEYNGPVYSEICLSAETMAQSVVPQSDLCQSTVTKQKPDMMEVTLRCSYNTTETITKTHFEFAGEKMAGAILTRAPQYNMEFRTIVRGKYLGACPAGKAPPKPLPQMPAPRDKPSAALPTYKP